jgi:hypothetical protein
MQRRRGAALMAGFIAKAFWYLRPGMEQVTAAEGVSEHLRVIGGFRLRPVRDDQEPR